MNIYIYDIFINHCLTIETLQEITYFNTVEIGPLNMPHTSNLHLVKDALSNISSTLQVYNWWTDFSSWGDFHALLCTGTKLSIHSVVEEIKNKLEYIPNAEAYIDMIDENRDIRIILNKNYSTLMQGFQITAKRKRLEDCEI